MATAAVSGVNASMDACALCTAEAAAGGDGVNEAEQRTVDPETIQWVKERLRVSAHA